MPSAQESYGTPTVQIVQEAKVEISNIEALGVGRGTLMFDPETRVQINLNGLTKFHTKSIRHEHPKWPDALKFTLPINGVISIVLLRTHTLKPNNPEVLGQVMLKLSEHLTTAGDAKGEMIGPLKVEALTSSPRKPTESLKFFLKIEVLETSPTRQSKLMDEMQDNITRITPGTSKLIDVVEGGEELAAIEVPDELKVVGGEVATALLKATGCLDKWVAFVSGVAALTPYSAPAAAVLKAAYEAWKAQKERDSKVAELSQTIADLWEFMVEDKSLEKVKTIQKTIQGMLRQTEECAKFIKEYTTSEKIGIRLARSMFSNTDAMIKDFQGAFAKLKSDYLNGINLASIVTMTSINDKLELMQKTLEILAEQSKAQNSVVPTTITVSAIVARPLRQKIFGRDDYILPLAQTISSNTSAWIPVIGPVGIGKTAIGLSIINHDSVVKAYGNRRHFVQCESVASGPSSSFLELLANHLGARAFASQPLEDISRFLQSQSTTPCILVLDDIDALSDQGHVRTVLHKLAEIRNFALIVTSKCAAPDGIEWSDEPEEVPRLSLEFARATFKDKYSVPPESEADLDNLLKELDGVPFTIRTIASTGKSSKLTVKQLLDKWRSDHSSVTPLPRSRDRTVPVLPSPSQGAVDQSVELLLSSDTITSHPDASRLLSVLVSLPNGAQGTRLTEMFTSMKDPKHAAEVLVAASLVTKDDRGIYEVAASIASYVSRHVPADPGVLLDVGLYYAKLALSWSTAVKQGRVANIQADILHEQRNLEAILQIQLSQDSPDPSPIQAAICYSDFQQYTAAKTEIINLAINAARKMNYTTLLGYCLQRFGDTCYTQDRYGPAKKALQEARTLLQQDNEHEAAAKCLFTTANIWRVQEYGRKAKPMFQQAMVEFKECGSKAGEAQCLTRIGEIDYFISESGEQTEQAKIVLHDAKKIFESIQDKRGIADCLRIIGRITSIGQKDFDEGHPILEESLKGFQAIGDRGGEGQVYQILGWALENEGEYEEALKMFKKALVAFVTIGDRLGEKQCKQKIGKYKE